MPTIHSSFTDPCAEAYELLDRYSQRSAVVIENPCRGQGATFEALTRKELAELPTPPKVAANVTRATIRCVNHVNNILQQHGVTNVL